MQGQRQESRAALSGLLIVIGVRGIIDPVTSRHPTFFKLEDNVESGENTLSTLYVNKYSWDTFSLCDLAIMIMLI